MDQKNMLWYRQPAGRWIEALPVGNGRLGAMVYGGSETERIQVDESTFWSGEASETDNRKDTKELLQKIRTKLLEKDYEEADRIGHDFTGNKNNYGTNMPVGNLVLDFKNEMGEITQYERSLDLAKGIAGVRFMCGGVSFEREALVSNPAQVMALCIRADQPFFLNIRYDGIENDAAIVAEQKAADKREYRISANARETRHSDGKCGVHLEGRILIDCDGKCTFESGSIAVEECRRMVLYMDLETTMFCKEPEAVAQRRVREAAAKGFERIRREHIEDVAPMYERVSLNLGEDRSGQPTDVRIRQVADGKQDNDLMSLMFQYGRYLLIASSREDSPLPTHMGGIWNDNIYNNTDCTQDMHIDMNLQMQYWAAAQCSLPECYKPFMDYVEKVLMPSGKKTAREAYGAKGWTAHVVSNPWGFTSLGWAYNWGAWSLGGAWCATLAWDYYEYTQDEEWLCSHGYPIMEGAAEFVLDYVFLDTESGLYMTGPSYSPENRFRTNGRDYFLSLSNTCDILMVREILTVWRKAAQLLHKGEHVQLAKAKEVIEKLPDYQIGEKGQIQEWFYDFDEPIPNHRHTSHLLGLYPFHQIIPDRQPELATAAEKSIALRKENFEITSWGMNMLAGYYARLSRGNDAMDIIRKIFQTIVKPNMASVMSDETTMWAGTWEMDGNTGLTSVIAEMLVHRVKDEIKILPALPEEWTEGSLNGISVKGGHKADISWKDAKPESLVLYPGREETVYVSCRGNKQEITLGKEQIRLEFR